jgi:hypothetical protein
MPETKGEQYSVDVSHPDDILHTHVLFKADRSFAPTWPQIGEPVKVANHQLDTIDVILLAHHLSTPSVAFDAKHMLN